MKAFLVAMWQGSEGVPSGASMLAAVLVGT